MRKLKIVAFILARKGSTRLKKKNLQLISGKTSLIKSTINFAKKLKYVDDIVLSSDDKKIYKFSFDKKILSPGIRPSYLSKKNTKSEQVAKYLLKWYEKKKGKIDALLLLQPTTPFRNIRLFNSAHKVFLKKNKTIIGVTEVFKKPNTYYFYKQKRLKKLTNKKKNFNNFFYIDGSMYLIPRNLFFKKNTFVPNFFYPIINRKIKYSIDIDYLRDLKLARLMFKQNF